MLLQKKRDIQTDIHTRVVLQVPSVFNRGPKSDAYTSFTSFNILGGNIGECGAGIYK